MPRKIITPKVVRPCSEDWNQMEPRRQAAFCQKCQKEVTDFTTMADEALHAYLKQASGRVCGRFKVSQLNRPYTAPLREVPYSPFRWVAASLIGISLVLGQAFAATPNPKAPSGIVQADFPLGNVPHKLKITIKNHLGFPLGGAMIQIKSEGISFSTSPTGEWEGEVPDSLLNKSLLLQISSPGFLPQERSIYVSQEVKTLEFSLVPSGNYPLQFQVTGDDGKPATGASVNLYQGNEYVATGITNDKGIVILYVPSAWVGEDLNVYTHRSFFEANKTFRLKGEGMLVELELREAILMGDVAWPEE